MAELIENAKQFWALIVLIATGAGTGVSWIYQRKKNRTESLEMMYEQLEALRQKVILQVEKSVQDAEELAEKQRIIRDFQLHCPGCYESFIQKKMNDANN